VRQRRRPYRERDGNDEDVLSDDLSAVNDRLDDLTRQIERMTQSSEIRPSSSQHNGDRVADALARLDHRLEQVIDEDRAPLPQRFTHADQSHEVSPPPTQPTYASPPAYSPPPQAYAPPQGHAAPPKAHAPMPTYASPPEATPAPPTLPTPSYAAAPSPGSAPSGGQPNWMEQILARQRVLDGAASAPPPVPPSPQSAPTPADSTPNLAGVEQQLRHINSQISTLLQPYENSLDALRNDLADIGRALTEAVPRQTVEALEGEVRALAERIDRAKQAGADTNALGAWEHALADMRDALQGEVRALAERVDRSRQVGADSSALGALEHGLAEVRDALRRLTPAESLAGFEQTLHALSHKIDRLAAAAQSGTSNPLAISQLEQAILSLRSIVPNVASAEALAQLSADVQALTRQFERVAADGNKLDAHMMNNRNTIRPELEGAIRELNERLERTQISRGDHLALGALEDRIANLSQKLDASDARLRQFDSIERGLGDLLVYFEEMRRDGRSVGATAPPGVQQLTPDPAARLPQSPLDLLNDLPPLEAVAPPARSPLDLLHEPPPAPATPVAAPRPASPPAPPAPPSPVPTPTTIAAPAPAPIRPSQPKAITRTPERTPIEPYLPPDTPLEPGSGTPRLKPGSAAARIAASEAALSQARTANEPSGKSALIAAARSAAKAAYLDTPVKSPQGLGARTSGLFKWPFTKKSEAPTPRPPQDSPKPLPELPAAPSIQPAMSANAMSHDPALDRPMSRRTRALGFVKTVLIAASVAIIVVGAVQTAWELLFPDEPIKPPVSEQPAEKPQATRPLAVPSWPTLPPGDAQPATPPAAPAAPATNDRSSFFDPATIMTSKPQATEVTGSVARQPMPSRTPAAPAAPAAEAPVPDSMPSGISAALRTAAVASNPAAEYEIGARYAEGRGVPQNSQEAIRWFEKAANAGFIPAQFRLASLNEKGDGVKKDVQAARRLYLAAAGKGHAKAMHNLAVLYAEGIDGKPDFKAAGQWFRKAAGYGITDSQYNLAILYARGIGVEPNLAESYKWFALAAANGDTEAAKKRDDIGSQLDKNTLTAAKLAIQTFVPDREPDEVSNLRVPPGGWDRAQAAAPVTPRRRTPASPTQ
jgi:localization factor PodJL